jgi:2,3-bisphosphoglycerate-independent phosphoglycerate mutase
MIETFIQNVKDFDNDFIICVTGDHTTPTYFGDHSYEPVPILICLLSNFLEKNN